MSFLPTLPAGWQTRRLKFIATSNDEVLPESTDDFEQLRYVEISGVSLVGGIENVSDVYFYEAPSRARRCVRSGDVLISTVRTYLKAIAAVRTAEPNLIASTGFCVVRAGPDIDSEYLGWVTKSEPFVSEMVARSTGVSYPAIKPSELTTLDVPLPSRETQRCIASFLDERTACIDALVEKKRALLDRLAEKRQAIITQAVTKGLDPAVPMKDSGAEWLGQVPTHWEVMRLKRVVESATYGTSAALNPDGEIAVLRMGNLVNGEIDVTDLKYLDDLDESLLLEAGDIVFNRTNSIDLVGKAALYRGGYTGQLSLASYLVRFRFSDRYCPDFANYVMGTTLLLDYAQTFALRSIGQANLSPSRYTAIEFPVPPPPEQDAIVCYLESQISPLASVAERLQESMTRLMEYRAALITAAVTGQVEIGAAALGEMPSIALNGTLAAEVA